jgi:hypothetical protein
MGWGPVGRRLRLGAGTVARARLPLRAGTVCASTWHTARPVASNTRPAASAELSARRMRCTHTISQTHSLLLHTSPVAVQFTSLPET